jgi:hypothetical protein
VERAPRAVPEGARCNRGAGVLWVSPRRALARERICGSRICGRRGRVWRTRRSKPGQSVRCAANQRAWDGAGRVTGSRPAFRSETRIGAPGAKGPHPLTGHRPAQAGRRLRHQDCARPGRRRRSCPGRRRCALGAGQPGWNDPTRWRALPAQGEDAASHNGDKGAQGAGAWTAFPAEGSPVRLD